MNLDEQRVDKHEVSGFKKTMNEEVPVNNVGAGKIAGVGVGDQGEPGVKKKKKLASFISFIKR